MRDRRDPGRTMVWPSLFRCRPQRAGQDLFEMGRLHPRRQIRSHPLWHAASLGQRDRSDAAAGAGRRRGGARRCRHDKLDAGTRALTSVIFGITGGSAKWACKYGARAELARALGDAPAETLALSAGMDVRQLRGAAAKRHRGPGGQPLRFRRLEFHRRRRLRRLARGLAPGGAGTRDRACSDLCSAAASTPCRGRSASPASARRRRCRRPGGAVPLTRRPTARRSPRASRWWCSSG